MGACWHLTDPATGLFVWTGYAGEVPGDFMGALENEYLQDDVAKYSDLAARREPVAALTVETGGDLRLRAAGLTDREREIAVALIRGDDTAAIAASLHLSPYTVQDHLKRIFDKTGVRSRRAFVAQWAFQAAMKT